jgi:hypothetical protein
MMKQITDQHLKEWDEFFQQRNEALERLEKDEFLIRAQFPVIDTELPPVWKEKIERDRQEWTETWGLEGAKASELIANQQRNKEQLGHQAKAEAEHILQDRYTDLQIYEYEQTNLGVPKYRFGIPEKAMGNKALEDFYDKNPGYAIRELKWEEMQDEHNAIRKYYKDKGEYVPLATQRRMAKHVSDFRQQWDHTQPEVPDGLWQTLSKKELAEEFQSWKDLTDAHKVIEQRYSGPESNIPEESMKRMTSDIKQFWKEMDTYKEAQRVQMEKDLSDNFREHLKNMQLRSQRSMKPRGPG